MSNSTHYFRPLGKAMLERSTPDMSGVENATQRERDDMFVRELAKAFQRGDHLPQGTVIPLKLIG